MNCAGSPHFARNAEASPTFRVDLEKNMASHQSRSQKRTIGRVMHEFKHGELKSSRGGKVKNPKQAVAIALQEAGASKYESGAENKRHLAKTKRKERRGETAEQDVEGRSHVTSRKEEQEETRAVLYRRTQRRSISGRSKMNKTELKRALNRSSD
jgi:hypothetical protein